jgi:hypothetical protein
MVDSLYLRYETGAVGAAEKEAFRRAVPGLLRVESVDDGEGGKVVSWRGEVPKLGMVKMTAGGEFYLGRSLSLVRQELDGVPERDRSNGVVLSARRAGQTWQDWDDCIKGALPCLGGLRGDVRRADVVYDRQAVNPMAVLAKLPGAIKPTRLGFAWFSNGHGQATGLMLRGRAVVHRVYDKGLESGDSRWRNVLRSEEQMRAGAVGLGEVVDLERMEFRREEGVSIMNDRYAGEFGEALELDVRPLVEAGAWAQVALTLNPELLGVYKATVTKDGYYKMVRKVRATRARAVPVDLRVPADAWTEEEAA